jgi:hydroxyacylglutathione hydrolase
MTLTIHRVVTGRWRENCYVAHDDDGDAVIVDPGADAPAIDACIDDLGLHVKAILLTHGHFDHIGAVAPLRERHGVPSLLHEHDHKLVRRANLYRTIFDADEPIELPSVDSLPADWVPFTIDQLTIEAIHTPGHTPGGVCYRIGADLFSGDTFHRGQAGRVDLPGGDARQLANSLVLLRGLAPGIRVHPGHGASTTIGAEVDSGALANSWERA